MTTEQKFLIPENLPAFVTQVNPTVKHYGVTYYARIDKEHIGGALETAQTIFKWCDEYDVDVREIVIEKQARNKHSMCFTFKVAWDHMYKNFSGYDMPDNHLVYRADGSSIRGKQFKQYREAQQRLERERRDREQETAARVRQEEFEALLQRIETEDGFVVRRMVTDLLHNEQMGGVLRSAVEAWYKNEDASN